MIDRRQLLTGALTLAAAAALPSCIKQSAVVPEVLPGWVVDNSSWLPGSQEEFYEFVQMMRNCIDAHGKEGEAMGFAWHWPGRSWDERRIFSFSRQTQWVVYRPA